MYLQFREFIYHGLGDIGFWIHGLRKELADTNWAICTYEEEEKTAVGIVMLDLPKVPWYMAGSPTICFMADQLAEKNFPELEKAMDRTEAPKGDYHVKNLGVDHSTLLLREGYEWGPDQDKVRHFVDGVDRGKFIDEGGWPCDTCVDEQQFYGCPLCDFNPLANEDGYEEEDWEDIDFQGENVNG